jgi:hypothetical protein
MISNIDQGFPESVETNSRHFLFQCRQHADGAMIIATKPDRNDNIFGKINPGVSCHYRVLPFSPK